MRRTLKYKQYDTERANSIGVWTNTNDTSDPGRFAEELFRKRTGEFFLYQTGGPASKYARSAGPNTWEPGEYIVPVSLEDAGAWIKAHLDPAIYDREFGKVIDDESTIAISISFPVKVHQLAKRNARVLGLSVSGYIAKLITEDTDI